MQLSNKARADSPVGGRALGFNLAFNCYLKKTKIYAVFKIIPQQNSKNKFNKKSKGPAVAHTSLIPGLTRHRQVVVCEIKASLVYIVSCRPARAI